MKAQNLYTMTIKRTYSLKLKIVARTEKEAEEIYNSMTINQQEELDFTNAECIAQSIECDAIREEVMTKD